MQPPISAAYIDGRLCDADAGPDILRRARMRTLASRDVRFRLESPRRRFGLGLLELLDPDALLDALVAVEAAEARESAVVAGVDVVRFKAILRRPAAPKELIADVWVDDTVRVRRIVAARRRSALLRRSLTGRVPERRAWRLEVSFRGGAARTERSSRA